MKLTKRIQLVLALVSAFAFALIPATGAQASAITQTGLLSQSWGYQYGSAVSPDGNIQVILDETHGGPAYFVYADTETIVPVVDPSNYVYYPMNAAFSPDGSTVYVTSYGHATTIIDVASHTATGTVPGSNPHNNNWGVGVSPDGQYLVQTNDSHEVGVFDISNNYAQVGSYAGTADRPYKVFFPNSSTAYISEEDGTIEVLNIASSTITDTWPGSVGTFGGCANADATVIAIVPWGSPDFDIQFVNPATGDVLGTVDMSGISGLSVPAFCSITAQGKLLITDWDSDDDQIYVVDATTFTFLEAVPVDLGGGGPTDSINVMAGCKAFVAGYFANLAILQLPQDYCEQTTPSLPDTGASQGLIITLASVGGGLLVLGVIALVLVRRRNNKQ